MSVTYCLILEQRTINNIKTSVSGNHASMLNRRDAFYSSSTRNGMMVSNFSCLCCEMITLKIPWWLECVCTFHCNQWDVTSLLCLQQYFLQVLCEPVFCLNMKKLDFNGTCLMLLALLKWKYSSLLSVLSKNLQYIDQRSPFLPHFDGKPSWLS